MWVRVPRPPLCAATTYATLFGGAFVTRHFTQLGNVPSMYQACRAVSRRVFISPIPAHSNGGASAFSLPAQAQANSSNRALSCVHALVLGLLELTCDTFS